ncbi:MAG: spermidine/putrescine ABC transporter substrate-binding protein [Chloroflexi bacterium]|nr:spermidine/putrescine ABC transporter substrate-binding protein [Chloroflexota bacterium]
MNRRNFLKFGIGLSAGAGMLAACGKAVQPTAAPASEAKPVEAPAAGAAAANVDRSKLAKEVSWYTWGGYTSDAILAKFKEEFGVTVKVDTFGSNEEMEAKFKAGGNPGYDVITPSDYMVARMAAASILQKVDFTNVPNFANIDAGHKGLYFDASNEYAVAYNWGTTGLAYDKTKVKEPITNWKQVMAWPAELKGKLGLLDDMRELMSMALRFKGFSGNTSKGEEIEAAKQALIDLKKSANYTLTDSPSAKTNLVAGDSVAAMIYTNDAVVGRSENPNLVYVIPGDVSTVWQDNMCVPVGAPSKYTAEVLMDFLCRPDIAAQGANEIGLSTPNAETIKQGLIDKALTGDKALYPDIVGLGAALDYLRRGDPAADELYQRAFDEIKSA